MPVADRYYLHVIKQEAYWSTFLSRIDFIVLYVFSSVELSVSERIISDPLPVSLGLTDHEADLTPTELFLPLLHICPAHLLKNTQNHSIISLQSAIHTCFRANSRLNALNAICSCNLR